MSPAKLVIVDTDAGVDDAHAILMLLAASAVGNGSGCQQRQGVNVLAVTTVRGNVGVDQVCLNVLRTLKVANRLDIPVHRGCDRTLIGTQNVLAVHYHGLDGLGDVPDPDAPDASFMQEENAVLAMIRLVNQFPGQITLLCIGPLTNVAVALRLDPHFGKKLQQCVIMGGNSKGKGNITGTSEFNFYVDPESANVVLTQLRCPITLITWELCLEYAMSWDWYSELSETPTPRGRFLRSIQAQSIANYYAGRQSDDANRQRYITCDEIAAAVVIDDRVCAAAASVVGRVEIDDQRSRGQLVVDWTNQGRRRLTNVNLVTRLNVERYEQLLKAAAVD